MPPPEVHCSSACHPRSEIASGALTWLAEHVDWFDPCGAVRIPHPAARFSPLLELLQLRTLLEQRPNPFPSGTVREFNNSTLALTRKVAKRSSELRTEGTNIFYLTWLLLEMGRLSESPRSAPPHPPLSRSMLPPGPFADLEHAFVATGFPGRTVEEGRCDIFERWYKAQNYGGIVGADRCYELTHAVMYLTNFGREEVAVPFADDLRALSSLMLAASLRSDQLDLAVELVFTQTILGEGSSALVSDGWERLHAVQQSGGSIAGPMFDQAAYASCPDERAEAYLVATSYHTTLATCIAATLDPADWSTCGFVGVGQL